MGSYDLHVESERLRKELENSLHERDHRGRELHLFDTKEILIIEKHLSRAFECGSKRKKKNKLKKLVSF